jgi:hypothetical protein
MSSIFDLSGQSPKKKPAEKPAAPKPAVALSGDSVQLMLEKIKSMSNDLAVQLEQTEKKLGVGPDELKSQLEEIGKISPETMNQIKSQKIELEKKILGLTEQQLTKRKVDQSSHKKKGKTLGARKGWIDMR